MGRFVIKEEDSLKILGSLRFFFVTHSVFSSVGEEMLTGVSVVVGWDQLQRTGPKDDHQVTVGTEGTGFKCGFQGLIGTAEP